MRHLLVVLCASAVLASMPSPAKADGLSLRDGGLLETKGPWKEKGKMIVYTAASGPLVSVRASEVDLAMSKAIGTRLQKLGYVDFGAASDPSDPEEHHNLVDERGNTERSKLQKFVQDPKSPRVSGTVSAQSNDNSMSILGDRLEGTEDEALKLDKATCQGRFAGSSAYDLGLMRAGIASEMRKAAEDNKEQEFVDAELRSKKRVSLAGC